jgi:O-antigen/teichoic acid export membrane protein
MRSLGELRAIAADVRTSRVVRNVVSNYFTVAWTAALSLVTIPVYVRLLGASEWGMIAACMTLQSFLALMDVGFGQIMPRSFARVAGDRAQEAKLFVAYSRIYLVLAGLGFIGGQLVAATAAHHWFHASGPDAARLETALRLIVVQFLFQFANNAHAGYWSGMQLQEEGNLRACAFATARHAGALAAVFYATRSALGYLVPFAAVSAVEWLWNRRAILRRYADGALAAARVRSADVHAILRDAGVFTVAIVVGLLVTQADRLVLSATQDLTQYGYYVVVANLGMAFMNLQVPLMKAFFPRIAREDALGEGGDGRALRALLLAVTSLCVVPCLLVAAAAPRVLTLWLHSPEIVGAGTLPLRLMLVAIALNAVYGVVYQRILSTGDSRAALVINVVTLAVVGVVVRGLGTNLGIVLGGVIWMSISSTQVVLGAFWLARRRARRARTGPVLGEGGIGS